MDLIAGLIMACCAPGTPTRRRYGWPENLLRALPCTVLLVSWLRASLSLASCMHS